jgi:hypothetical protein
MAGKAAFVCVGGLQKLTCCVFVEHQMSTVYLSRDMVYTFMEAGSLFLTSTFCTIPSGASLNGVKDLPAGLM